MNMKVWMLLVCVLCIAGCGSASYGYTLTFDDIPSGQDLGYYTTTYGVMFSKGFDVSDHSGATWGLPHSGSKVLTWTFDSKYTARIEFGESERYSIRSLGAFFSTDAGIVVKMTAYHTSTDTPLASVTIGDTESSWDNRYVEISSEAGNIDFVEIEGVYSADSRLGFCADDMSITTSP